MDKSLYIAFSGVTRAMKAQQVHANNLANLNSRGFRKDFVHSIAAPLQGDGHHSRVMTVATGTSSAMGSGTAIHTGRNLDLAIADEGWMVVQDDDGKDAYTRAGHLSFDEKGKLITSSGRLIVGNGGDITIPAHRHLEIGGDGMVSVIPTGIGRSTPVVIGQIKLVNPDPKEIIKGEDGLFRRIDGTEEDKDASVTVKTGYLESSNVNAVEEMIQFMNLSRQFELQFKVMKAAETLAASGDQLLRME
ncbi:MAG: flagellar basal body rod protein FlgF [Endozoicomonadaceae bacterium]|nr:flagellar basal body rod protein FlgF [Endozoicomonadaceae bacterium]